LNLGFIRVAKSLVRRPREVPPCLRIRLFASGSVLEAAEAFVKKLVEKYGEKNMSIDEIKSVALEQHDAQRQMSGGCNTMARG
jgi:hypothetical protein